MTQRLAGFASIAGCPSLQLAFRCVNSAYSFLTVTLPTYAWMKPPGLAGLEGKKP